ncbi:DDE-type integrase/transposase/recombinase, partial [Vibrio alginolyticus]|nr:DDE-type integrase/transposase/recombinase [Vibrio alginolyticus]
DRGSQYTSKRYQKLLKSYGIRSSMGDVGACWDNAVVERFFGSLKHDWLFKVPQPTREHMKQDVTDYMKYYNVDRLHFFALSPIAATIDNKVRLPSIHTIPLKEREEKSFTVL